jgi:hypothetical protein
MALWSDCSLGLFTLWYFKGTASSYTRLFFTCRSFTQCKEVVLQTTYIWDQFHKDSHLLASVKLEFISKFKFKNPIYIICTSLLRYNKIVHDNIKAHVTWDIFAHNIAIKNIAIKRLFWATSFLRPW